MLPPLKGQVAFFDGRGQPETALISARSHLKSDLAGAPKHQRSQQMAVKTLLVTPHMRRPVKRNRDYQDKSELQPRSNETLTEFMRQFKTLENMPRDQHHSP